MPLQDLYYWALFIRHGLGRATKSDRQGWMIWRWKEGIQT